MRFDDPHGPLALWHQAAGAIVGAQVELWAAFMRELAGAQRELTDAQRDLWPRWVAAASGVPRPAGGADAGTVMLGALREGARQLVDNQAEWARRWNAAGPTGPRPPAPFARP